jgi:hypothetical protein
VLHFAAVPPRWATLLLLPLLPLVWRAAYSLAVLATRDLRLARFLSPGVALAGWLLAIHVAALVAHSFGVGLFAGTLLLAAAGVASWRVPLRGSDSEPAERTSRWMWLGAILAAALVLAPEFWWTKHDECLLTGHLSIPAEIQNGIYPPRHITFPVHELRYHYGIDLAAAAVSSVLGRLDIPTTVHALACLLWGTTFCLAWLLGERVVGGRASGPVTAVCVLFAGGAPYFCRPTSPAVDYLTSMCTAGGTWITPPLVSNFLQHPWSLGVPLFVMVLLLAARFAVAGTPPAGWVLLSLVVLVLSFSQVVLFLCVVPALVGAGALAPAQSRAGWLRRAALLLAWGVAMVLSARALHGFFARVTEPSEGRLELHPFWLDASPREWLAWHLQAFGALLPLGIAGFFVLRGQPRVLLAILAVGSLLVRDLFRYVPGWNIVKFSVVTQIVLALSAAAALCWAFARPRLRILAAVGLVASTFFGFVWALALTANRPQRGCVPEAPSAQDQAAIDFLRGRVGAGEGVYRSEGADAYAMLGGLPQPTWDWGAERFGFGQRLFAERRRLLAHPDDLDALRSQGFRWLVVGPRDGALRQAVQRWIDEDRAERVADFPPLVVVRLR